MNEHWREYLLARSADIRGAEVVSFAHPERELAAIDGPCTLCDLSHLGVIAVQGEDAETFLQGQLTSDIRSLGPKRSQLAGYCTPKGRLLAVLRVFRSGDDDGIRLQLPGELLEPTIRRLRMYVLRSAVTLTDISSARVRIGVAGAAAEAILRAVLDPPEEGENALTHADGLTLLRLPGAQPRFELLGEIVRIRCLWESLARQATPVGLSVWSLLDIRAGIPTIYAKTSDAFVPQMANMQLVGGLSFTKGCYTGQEVVARMEYLGRLKRRMYWARVISAAPPAPGDELYGPADTGQSIGKIVDAQPSPAGGYELLAVVQINGFENGEVRLGSANGPQLRFDELPYAFEMVSSRAGG